MNNFGYLNSGEKVSYYILENDNFRVKIIDFGATLVSFVVKDLDRDIVQGFIDPNSYIDDVEYMGASVGRNCNRIQDGKFVLNNEIYNLYINNGPNSLHGGKFGFNRKIFNVKQEENVLYCTYFSKDLEEGYPGNLKVLVKYILEDDGLVFEYSGISDKDTIFNMCNHAFFNLNGHEKNTCLDHLLKINSNYVGKIDSDGLSLDEVFEVSNTPFDFRSYKEIGRDINQDDEQIKNGNGYDHHFMVDGIGYRKMLSCLADKISMDVYSDLPGFHLYTSNYLGGTSKGKDNANYPSRSSVCFESEYYPNSINYDKYIKPILRANEEMVHKTKFVVRVEEESENKRD